MRLSFLCTLFTIGSTRIHMNGFSQKSPSGFALARLQQDYEDDNDDGDSFSNDENRRKDEVESDAKCLERCNHRLNIGMDMVNAHMSFGSIDVPSVISPKDLDLFCQLDSRHTRCIDDCGYTVQFNLREFICRRRFNQHIPFIPTKKVGQFIGRGRKCQRCERTPAVFFCCGAVLDPSLPTEMWWIYSIATFADWICQKLFDDETFRAFHVPEVIPRHRSNRKMTDVELQSKQLIRKSKLFRCRQLLCDHTCTSFILSKVCGNETGQKAGDFLMDFTRLQVLMISILEMKYKKHNVNHSYLLQTDENCGNDKPA